MTPVPKTRDRVSLYARGAEPSANSFLPPPSTTGKVKMVVASRRSSARSEWTSSVLPRVRRLGPSSSRRRFTSAMSRTSTEPCQLVSTPPERETTYFLISLKSFGMPRLGASFPDLVRPILRENLVGLAADQEIEFLTEVEAVKFLPAILILIGARPAAELEPLARSHGLLHDAVHGNPGADDDFPHGL